LDIDGHSTGNRDFEATSAAFFYGKGIMLREISAKALMTMNPAKNGSKHVEDDGPGRSEDANSGAHNLRQAPAI
jgi:hypothetical protein